MHIAFGSPISGHFVASSNQFPNCLIGSKDTSWLSSKHCGSNIQCMYRFFCYQFFISANGACTFRTERCKTTKCIWSAGRSSCSCTWCLKCPTENTGLTSSSPRYFFLMLLKSMLLSSVVDFLQKFTANVFCFHAVGQSWNGLFFPSRLKWFNNFALSMRLMLVKTTLT